MTWKLTVVKIVECCRSPASEHQSPTDDDRQVSQAEFGGPAAGSHPGSGTRCPAEQPEFRRGAEEPRQAGGTGSSGRGAPGESEKPGATSSRQRTITCQGEPFARIENKNEGGEKIKALTFAIGNLTLDDLWPVGGEIVSGVPRRDSGFSPGCHRLRLRFLAYRSGITHSHDTARDLCPATRRDLVCLRSEAVARRQSRVVRKNEEKKNAKEHIWIKRCSMGSSNVEERSGSRPVLKKIV